MIDPGLTTAPVAASTKDEASVARAARCWRACFWLVYLGTLAIKLAVASRLAPFSDEAFYWQESRHLDWGYSDLPGMTAWLIALGERLGGHGVLAMRAPFLLLGSLLPWLVRDLALRLAGPVQGWQAALWCLALPLASSLGVLALPDVPLTVAMLAAICALCRLRDDGSLLAWLSLGLSLAAACATHYRAAPLVLTGLWLILATPRGRGWWRQPGAWLAFGLAAVGLVPLLMSNLRTHGAGLAFQLWQRNPWHFHADTLVQPLEQAGVCTPLLYGLLAWAGLKVWCRRRQGWVWQVLAIYTVILWLGYAMGGLFADDARFRLHWPLPGYLPLLAVLPVLWAERQHGGGVRVIWGASWWLGWLATLAGLGLLWAASLSPLPQAGHWGKLFPMQFTGWRESASMVAQLRRPGQLLVADNFILGAELDFSLAGQSPVYVLDSPLNRYHGRAPQLALWQLDLPALRRRAGKDELLLVVDETALRERWRWSALEHLCGELASVRPLGRLEPDQKRRRFGFYAIRLRAVTAAPRRCVIWTQAHAATYPDGPG